MAGRNPFSPTFGAPPPVIAGRGDMLDAFGDAFETGPTHPDFTAFLVGVRGAGKTVMLDAVQGLASSRGWMTISDDASPKGLLGRLTRASARLMRNMERGHGRRLRSVTRLDSASSSSTQPNPRTLRPMPLINSATRCPTWATR